MFDKSVEAVRGLVEACKGIDAASPDRCHDRSSAEQPPANHASLTVFGNRPIVITAILHVIT